MIDLASLLDASKKGKRLGTRSRREPEYFVDHHAMTLKLGKRMFRMRRAKRLSQKEMAARLGVSLQQLQKYESGRTNVTVSRLLQFCLALKLDPHDLIDEMLPQSEPRI